jgi:hypothetical protein
MTGVERAVLLEESSLEEDSGRTMVMGWLVKTVSLRPTVMPAAGCCSQPAWIAVRTKIIPVKLASSSATRREGGTRGKELTVGDVIRGTTGSNTCQAVLHDRRGHHGAVIDIAVSVGLGMRWFKDTVLESILNASTGLRGDAGTRLYVCCVGKAKDAVVESKAEIIFGDTSSAIASISKD